MLFSDNSADRGVEIVSFDKMRYLCRVNVHLPIATCRCPRDRFARYRFACWVMLLLVMSACSYRPPSTIVRPAPSDLPLVGDADADRPLVLAVPHQPMPPIPSPAQLQPMTAETLSQSAVDSADVYRPPYTLGTNLVAVADTVLLACLPIRDCYNLVLRGERVVVAEWMTERRDTASDVVWVKLAHSEAVQGWVPEEDMKWQFVPTDPVSQWIHAFSHTHLPWFLVVCALTVVLWAVRLLWRRAQLREVLRADLRAVSGTLPLLLLLLVAAVAAVYQSIQLFAPALWERYYYAPSLSPLGQPWPLAMLLVGVWLLVVVLLATVDELFRRLSALHALLLLPLLASACICCYWLLILLVPVYLGYLLLLALFGAFVRRLVCGLRTPHYRCGRCGQVLTAKGHCPRCGAENV